MGGPGNQEKKPSRGRGEDTHSHGAGLPNRSRQGRRLRQSMPRPLATLKVVSGAQRTPGKVKGQGQVVRFRVAHLFLVM